MFIVNPFFFKSENAEYFYDDSTGIVLPINNEEKNFLVKIGKGTTLQDFNWNDEQNSIIKKIKKYNLFSYNNPSAIIDVNESLIKQIIIDGGIGHICLIMTDECNFRCKYCIFSDHYEYSKHFDKRWMSFEIAKKAIDYYHSINYKSIESNPNLRPSIGFYGGEPLLCWDTIVKIVEYTKEKFEDYVFSITTNGLLMDNSKVKYMLENRFSISISLDGGQKEHDRNRVDRNNKGTFDRVFNNLLTLHSATEARRTQNEEVMPYHILITYDNLTDLKSMNDFFAENKELQDNILNINKVNNQNTDYYKNQSTEEILDERNLQLMKLLKMYQNSMRTGEKNNFLKKLFDGFTMTCSSKMCYNTNFLRGVCIPGSHKLSIDVEGNFHICEKINPNYTIGNVYTGFDYEKITQYLKEVLAILDVKCKDCNLKNICSMCYVHMESDRGFVFNQKLCNDFKESIGSTFGLYYSLLKDQTTN